MVNEVVLMGRITKDLELRQTQQGVPTLSFTIAVERNYAKQGEERQSDFINCVAWRSTAEFINRYFSKGRMIAVIGNLRTRTYDDKNGTKHYVTEVYVDKASFTGEAKNSANTVQNASETVQTAYTQPSTVAGTTPAPDSNFVDDGFNFDDDGVPF